MSRLPPIPTPFGVKKNAILTSLQASPQVYTDLSPKGSVDQAIKDLIDRINALEGIVTTSSCSGRISVFLEGHKQSIAAAESHCDDNESFVSEASAAVPGGKGMGGRWLFTSHEPVELDAHSDITSNDSIREQWGLQLFDGAPSKMATLSAHESRLIKFQFEPMVSKADDLCRYLSQAEIDLKQILHIMTASLAHAQPILAAAINAGFRESGVQSLKNLNDANCFPMVAIRSSGLALESIVGMAIGNEEKQDEMYSIVGDEHLELLLKLANERFKSNTARMRRFEFDLFNKHARRDIIWEDSESRRTRKQAEGLRKQKCLKNEEQSKQII